MQPPVARLSCSLLSLCAAVLFACAPPALAADPKPETKPAAPQAAPSIEAIPPLKAWQERTQSRIDYVGERHGVHLWMASRKGSLQLLYTTPDNQALLSNGVLIGPDGTDETAALQNEFITQDPQRAEAILNTVETLRKEAPVSASANTLVPKPAGRSEQLWQDLSKAATIDFGPADQAGVPTAFVFTDPACDHCHALWATLQPAIEHQSLRIRLIPVALLGDASAKQAAQLLSQSDKPAGWEHLIAKQLLAEAATPAGQAAFDANQKLFKTYKLTSAPVVIYRQGGTGKVRILVGNPNDIGPFFKDIGLKPVSDAVSATLVAPAAGKTMSESDDKTR